MFYKCHCALPPPPLLLNISLFYLSSSSCAFFFAFLCIYILHLFHFAHATSCQHICGCTDRHLVLTVYFCTSFILFVVFVNFCLLHFTRLALVLCLCHLLRAHTFYNALPGSCASCCVASNAAAWRQFVALVLCTHCISRLHFGFTHTTHLFGCLHHTRFWQHTAAHHHHHHHQAHTYIHCLLRFALRAWYKRFHAARGMPHQAHLLTSFACISTRFWPLLLKLHPSTFGMFGTGVCHIIIKPFVPGYTHALRVHAASSCLSLNIFGSFFASCQHMHYLTYIYLCTSSHFPLFGRFLVLPLLQKLLLSSYISFYFGSLCIFVASSSLYFCPLPHILLFVHFVLVLSLVWVYGGKLQSLLRTCIHMDGHENVARVTYQ